LIEATALRYPLTPLLRDEDEKRRREEKRREEKRRGERRQEEAMGPNDRKYARFITCFPKCQPPMISSIDERSCLAVSPEFQSLDFNDRVVLNNPKSAHGERWMPPMYHWVLFASITRQQLHG
jgi:hypothetical protein